VQSHKFDPPEIFLKLDVCQLLPNTADGFPEIENQEHVILWQGDKKQQNIHLHPLHADCESNCDPPYESSQENYYDPPHEDYYDPPHESEYIDPIYE
jgi:hypothetical protein